MTRKQALEICRYAGYHNDEKLFTRTYIENRISYQKAREAFAQGGKAKDNGIKCTCRLCQNQPSE